MQFPVTYNSPPDSTPMSLEQYLDFIWFVMREADPEAVRKQKDYEEVIKVRFSLPEE